MHLARQDALAPYSGGRSQPRSKGYVTVREPAKGFFIAGSSIDDMNGIYAAVRADHLQVRRKVQVVYRNDASGWMMALVKAPPPSTFRRRRHLDRSRLPAGVLSESDSEEDYGYSEKFEWIFVDPLGRERFAHKGDTIIPGAGLRWWHLHRETRASNTSNTSKKEPNLPQLYWHECLEDSTEFETADESEEQEVRGGEREADDAKKVPSDCRAIMEPVKDDEDELPWQVIAVLDNSVIRDLRYSYRRYERTVAAARAGANLPKPGPHTLEYCCQQPRCWVYKVVAPGGVTVRVQPKQFAKSCGQRGCGQYVCGVETEGTWLRLARMQQGSADDSDAEAEPTDQWVCVQAKDGTLLLEAVRDSDVGCAKAPIEKDPQAEKFDRPFEPRLQAPDFVQESGVDANGAPELDMKKFEEKEEQSTPGDLPTVDLFVGSACVLQGLVESNKNGQACTVCKLPREDGRCVVQLADGQNGQKLAVKPSNLRPLKRPNESEQSYWARTLGLTLPTLGLVDTHPSEHVGCLQSVGPQEILAAALRAAQRDFSDAPEALVESQQAYDKLLQIVPAHGRNGGDVLLFAPHAYVENGLLGTRAAQAAMNAASQQSVTTVESGIVALRQVLSDEQRRLAREAGLEWPLPAACKTPSEGPDALRLRLTLIRALLRSRQEEQAALEAEACVRRHGQTAASLLWAGRCLLRVGRRDQGKRYLSMAAQTPSGMDGAWGHQGAAIRLQALLRVETCKLAAEDAYAYGDFKTAAARYGEAVVISPTDDKWGRATLHAARAACHRRARDLRLAVEDCDAALALFPNYARALYRRAACLIEAGRAAEAIKSLESLLRIDRAWPNLCDWLVRAHAMAKRMEEDRFKPSGKRKGRPVQQESAEAGTSGSLAGADLYAVLGVSSDATDQQLKRAYRLMSLKYHPDKQGGSTRDFQRIATAYETLSDPGKRHAYNEGADLNKRPEDSEESDRDEKSLREEVERKYFPERFKYWPFGDPFIEKRKLFAQRKRDAEQRSRPTPDRDDDW